MSPDAIMDKLAGSYGKKHKPQGTWMTQDFENWGAFEVICVYSISKLYITLVYTVYLVNNTFWSICDNG